MPSISIVTPTTGRIGLKVLMGMAQRIMSEDDEYLVMADGTDIEMPNDPRFKLHKTDSPHNDYGAFCSQQGIEKAQGDLICFFGDDDLMTEDSLEIIRRDALLDRPNMFQIRFIHRGVKENAVYGISRGERIDNGYAGQVQLVIPTLIKDRLPDFSQARPPRRDLWYLAELAKNHKLAWHEGIIAYIRITSSDI